LENYEVAIIGGGITGAGVFRDLALHGVSCVLIDKYDFSSKTSQSSSKMLHGGIRYLENYDFELVQEALHEKNLWVKLLPHLAKEQPFVLPIYKDSKYPLFMLKIGLVLYDFLSGFKNSPHQILGRKDTIKQRPLLNQHDLKGSGLYYDALMDDVKITLEVIYDALKEKRTAAINHTKVCSIKELKDENFNYELETENLIKGEPGTIKVNKIVHCLGPFTDKLLSEWYPQNWTPQLLPSKGSHLWVSKKDFNLKDPCVINHKDGRVIFFIPHETQVLIGTTEEKCDSDFETISISKNEIDYLVSVTNHYYPTVNLTPEKIQASYSGIRPLIKAPGETDQGKTARTHRTFLVDKNTQVIAGGKYTTFRTMAQDAVKKICQDLRVPYSKSKTIKKLRQKSVILPFEENEMTTEILRKILLHELPRSFEDLIHRRIGVNSIGQWHELFPNTDFRSFFKNNLNLINKYFPINETQINDYFL
jgi:glycerol-3-phosphate dehydrogenase